MIGGLVATLYSVLGALLLIGGHWEWGGPMLALGALMLKLNVDVIRAVRQGEPPRRSLLDLIDPPDG
jgi:hypothetical protein